MRRIACGLLLAFAFLPPMWAHAQKQKQQKDPCAEAQSQFEMNQCAHKEYLAADAELNEVYKQLSSKLDAEERAQLKAAEAAWIKYRDANCEYESFFYRGGTIRPLIHSTCLSRVTKARTAELKGQIEDRDQFE